MNRRDLEKCKDQLRKLSGLAPYNYAGNLVYGDPYFSMSIDRDFDRDIVEQAHKEICSRALKILPCIQTHSGRFFDYVTPEPKQFDILDIAHGLAKQSRFSGQTRGFYSVGQHSVMVSCLVPRHLAFQGLMHDAAEAFLGDVPTPLKQLLPDYKKIEERVEKVIFNKYGFENLDPEIKVADLIMLATEKRDFMPKHQYTPESRPWKALKGVKPLKKTIIPWTHEQAYTEFLKRFIVLKSPR